MKNILLSLSVFILIIFSGCSKFLDLAPISSVNTESFYKNRDDFENAIIGAYQKLRTSGIYNDNMQLVGDLRSDNTEMGTTASTRLVYANLSQFRLNTDNSISESIWNDHYNGIMRVNKILSKIKGFNGSESFKERIKAEAKFLRGLFYFNLVRIFGDVPLVVKDLSSIEEAYTYGRTKESEVYDQIILDLKDASNTLPVEVNGEEGRATKGAAWALLGKVYLTLHDYENAKTTLENVINLDEYDLLSNYEDLWEVKNKNNKESIFDVQFQESTTNSTGARFSERYAPYLYPYLGYFTTGGGYNIPTENIINSYESGDLRKDASVQESYVDDDGTVVTGLAGRFCIKFHDKPVEHGGSNDNWPVLRYADVLLMYAEALNEIGFVPNGPAFDYLNKIRERAGLPNKTAGNPNANLSIDSQDEFRKAVWHERRVELAFEGQRWFDLVRTGQAVKVLSAMKGIDIKDYQLLLPVPQSQIDINPEMLKQNAGY